MNEPEMQPPPPPLSPRRNRGILAAVMLAAVIVIGAGWYFLARPHITQALAERRIKELVDNFNAGAASQGAALTLAYAGVQVEREKMRDIVVIVNPSLSLNEEAASVRYDTRSIHIIPKNLDFSAMKVELRDTLQAKNADGSVTLIEHAKPLAVDLSTSGDKKQPIISYDATIPGMLEVKRFSGAPSSETIQSHARVTFNEPVTVKGEMDISGRTREFETLVRNLKVVDVAGNKPLLSMDEASLQMEQAALEENKLRASYRFALRGLQPGEEWQAYGPYAMALDITMEGMLPSADAANPASRAGSTVTLRKLELSGKNASLVGSGEMKTVEGDTLPVGSAGFGIKGLPFVVQEAASHGLLTDGQRALIEALVKKITGKNLLESEALNVEVKREQGGTLMIGQATLDDILALYISESINQGAFSDQPPLQDAPQATPIPENAPAEIIPAE